MAQVQGGVNVEATSDCLHGRAYPRDPKSWDDGHLVLVPFLHRREGIGTRTDATFVT